MKAASSRLKASTAVSSRAARLEADSDLRRDSGVLPPALGWDASSKCSAPDCQMAWNRRYRPTPGGDPLDKCFLALQKCGQGSTDMGIPAGLRSGQGSGIAAQIGQMRRKGLRHGHG